jgi:hypothetical protein
VFITNGLTRLIVIIYASKKAYEIFGEPNKWGYTKRPASRRVF